jgi:hypothetical protein
MKVLGVYNLDKHIMRFGLFVFFVIGGFLNGLIYELQFLFMGALLLIMLSVVWAVRREIRLYSFQIPLILLSLAYWAGAAYGWDKENAILEAARISCLVPLSFFLVVPGNGHDKFGMKLVTYTSILLVGFGLLFHLFREGRLESTFQYANSLAMLLLVSLLYALRLFDEKRGYLNLLLIVVSACALLMTASRFIWVLSVPACISCFIVYPGLRKFGSILRLAVMGGAGIVFYVYLTGIDALYQRMASIRLGTEELQLRFVYWKDAWKVIREYGWTGLGGGGWSLAGPEGYFVKISIIIIFKYGWMRVF